MSRWLPERISDHPKQNRDDLQLESNSCPEIFIGHETVCNPPSQQQDDAPQKKMISKIVQTNAKQRPDTEGQKSEILKPRQPAEQIGDVPGQRTEICIK